jgi:hypothetical protein
VWAIPAILSQSKLDVLSKLQLTVGMASYVNIKKDFSWYNIPEREMCTK